MGGPRMNWCSDELAAKMADLYKAKISLEDIAIQFAVPCTVQALYQLLIRRKVIGPRDGHRIDAIGRAYRAHIYRLSLGQITDAYSRYKSGESLESLANRYDCVPDTLKGHFRRLEDEMRAAKAFKSRPKSKSAYEPSTFIRQLTPQELMSGRSSNRGNT